MAWGVFKDHARSVRLQDNVYLAVFSKLSNIQISVIERRGFFFIDLDLEKHYVKTRMLGDLCTNATEHKFEHLNKFHSSIQYKVVVIQDDSKHT